jgi:sRNA-binding carbon storage regulator CsrA
MNHKVFEIRDNNHISSIEDEPLLEIDNINDYPERFDDVDMINREIPKFLSDILNEPKTSLNGQAVELFCRKFGIYYYRSKTFRKLTENYMVLFTGGDYVGIYKTRKELLDDVEIFDINSGLPRELSNIDEPLIEGLDPNDYPERVDEYNISRRNLPRFIIDRMRPNSHMMTKQGKMRFLMKFIINYYTSSGFRELVDGWIFMVIDRVYYGVYRNDGEAVEDAEKNGFTRRNGNSIITWDMYPQIQYEYNEKCLISNGYVTYHENKKGDKFPKMEHPYFTAQCGLGIIENNKPKLLTSTTEYIIDTGANSTRGCEDNYYDILNCEYKEYPFNDDNSQNLNPDLYKPEMKILNGMIIHAKLMFYLDANNFETCRTLLFFDKNTKFIIDDDVFVSVLSVSMQSSELTMYEDKEVKCDITNEEYMFTNTKKTILNSITSAKTIIKTAAKSVDEFGLKLVESSFKNDNEDIFIRSVEQSKLLGLDIILKTSPKIDRFLDNIFTLELSSENDKIEVDDKIYYTEYKVFCIKSGLLLYCSNTLQNFNAEGFFEDNFNNNYNCYIFYLKEERILCEYEDVSVYCKTYKTIKNLNLLMLNRKDRNLIMINRDIELKMRDYINKSNNIDGWITKEEEFPHSLHIWIKGDLRQSIEHIETKNNTDIKINVTPEEYYFKHLNGEIKTIMEHKIDEFIVKDESFYS